MAAYDKMSQDNNKRIAKNTLLLYFRMLFMMAVTLYTSRVILNTLGVEDYGIYNNDSTDGLVPFPREKSEICEILEICGSLYFP